MGESFTRPNVLFLMSDQQRFDALSCHTGWVQTPNLDRLAAAGVDFQRQFAQAPVCVPSRCSLFTGRYPHAHRVLENDARLAPHEVHLFKALKQAGYHLTYSGKNHLLPDAEMARNFDSWDDGHSDPAPDSQRSAYLKLESESLNRLATVGSYGSAAFHDFPDEVTTTGVIAAHAISCVRAAPKNRPWCAVASFHDPHVPHLAPRRFAATYPPGELPVPEFDPAELDDKPPRVRVKRMAQNAHKAAEIDRQHYLAVYGSMCTFVDEQIGRILDALARREDAGRTIVVFVSDHGDFAWHHGMCKKDLLLYDDLLHVPAILHCPSLFGARTITDTLTEHVDIVPTLLDLIGVEIPFGCQGRSLAPLLRGESSRHREEIHAEVCYPWMRSGFESYEAFRTAWQAANAAGQPLGRSAPYNVPGDYTKCVRTTEWKYIWFGDGFEELYDIVRDPAETRNLARDPAHTATRDALRCGLFEWLADTDDPRSPRTEREQLARYEAWSSPQG